MNPVSQEREAGSGYDAAGAGETRRDFLKQGAIAGAVSAVGLGGFYFGYEASLARPLRVGVIGTGDEGSVLIGALNPKFLEVRSIADIRPYNVFRALHGEVDQPVRPGLMEVYDWKTEEDALRHVKVYGPWQDLISHAPQDGVEAVIIALPLFLHAPVAIAAMQKGLHVLTEKLMGHSVRECKEMARVAAATRKHLATGHQRHYNILYAQAAEQIRRGALGELHFIRAQWHRSNLPTKDSWQQPLPPSVKEEKVNKLVENLGKLRKERDEWADPKNKNGGGGPVIEKLSKQIRQLEAQILDCVLHTGSLGDVSTFAEIKDTASMELAQKLCQLKEGVGRPAEKLGYTSAQIPGSKDLKVPDYDRPAVEELIRWRLWDRTAAGLMAELGSHQLDASSIFVAAAHGGVKQHPLNVVAAGNRPIFPNDRDCEDHVYCIIEFPAPGYDPKDVNARQKKIGVMYSSINGNGYGGYGEVVMGTKGELVLLREKELHQPSKSTEIKVSGGGGGPTLDTQSSGPAKSLASSGPVDVSRGYAEELEHWAWCIRNPAPENQPKCHPKVALGDAVIALVTNKAAREGKRIEFDEAWFDPDKDETPDGDKPDVTRYKA